MMKNEKENTRRYIIEILEKIDNKDDIKGKEDMNE
jgi:hypothetical protein